jgi:hypothetical protein
MTEQGSLGQVASGYRANLEKNTACCMSQIPSVQRSGHDMTTRQKDLSRFLAVESARRRHAFAPAGSVTLWTEKLAGLHGGCEERRR